MRHGWIAFLAVVSALALTPTKAAAQGGQGGWFSEFPSVAVELYGGLADHGRFLLQAIAVDPNGIVPQRELVANNAFSFGGAVSIAILPLTRTRLSFTHLSTDLDFDDDTGTGSGTLDDDDVAGLSSNVLSLEAMRFLLPARSRVSPYGGLGISLVWWNLDERRLVPLIIAGAGDDSHLRFAVSAILGVRVRVYRQFAVAFEIADLDAGNPFTGSESFLPTTGVTIDEPTRVRQTHFRLVGSYTFRN